MDNVTSCNEGFIKMTNKLLSLTQTELITYKKECNEKLEREREILEVINNLCDSIIKYNNATIKNIYLHNLI